MPNRIYDIEVTQDHIDKGTIPPSDSLFYFGDSTNPLALAALDAGFPGATVSFFWLFTHFMGGPRHFRVPKDAIKWLDTLRENGKDAVEPFTFQVKWG